MSKPLITYAQNREDLLLNAFFDDSEVGFYVDVGANHPVHESVTKLFYDKGWRGMNLEPTPRLYELLRLTRPRDLNVQVGVSDKPGSLKFREYPHGDGLSTFATEMQQNYEQANGFFNFFTSDYLEYEVPVKTLAELFKEYKVTTIDFMKVDIEGYEYEALAGNDWKTYRPKVLCIEANHIVKDWHDLIAKAGYELAFFDGLNEYFVAKEEHARAERFSYPDRVLLGPAYVSWREYKAEQDLRRRVDLLEYELETAAVQPAPREARELSAKQRIKHRLYRLDATMEAKLARPVVPSSFPHIATPIDSAEKLVAALVEQLRTTAEHRSVPTTSQKTYRSLKKHSKSVARRIIR